MWQRRAGSPQHPRADLTTIGDYRPGPRLHIDAGHRLDDRFHQGPSCRASNTSGRRWAERCFAESCCWGECGNLAAVVASCRSRKPCVTGASLTVIATFLDRQLTADAKYGRQADLDECPPLPPALDRHPVSCARYSPAWLRVNHSCWSVGGSNNQDPRGDLFPGPGPSRVDRVTGIEPTLSAWEPLRTRPSPRPKVTDPLDAVVKVLAR